MEILAVVATGVGLVIGIGTVLVKLDRTYFDDWGDALRLLTPAARWVLPWCIGFIGGFAACDSWGNAGFYALGAAAGGVCFWLAVGGANYIHGYNKHRR